MHSGVRLLQLGRVANIHRGGHPLALFPAPDDLPWAARSRRVANICHGRSQCPPVPSIPRASFDAAASVKPVHLNAPRPYSATTAPSVYSSQRGSFDVRAVGSKFSTSTRTSVPPSPRRGSVDTHSSSLRSSMKAPRPSLSVYTLQPPLPSRSTLDYFNSPISVSSGDGRSRSSARLSKLVPSGYF